MTARLGSEYRYFGKLVLVPFSYFSIDTYRNIDIFDNTNIYICSRVVLLLYIFYSLHCPLSGPDLIYISLLIIPCIIYHVTIKKP